MDKCHRVIRETNIGVKLECGGEMITIQSYNDQIKTRFCRKCGLIENLFNQATVDHFVKHAVKAETLKGEA